MRLDASSIILKQNAKVLCGSPQPLQNRKNCISRSHKRRQCWFIFTTLKVLFFGNSFHKVKMSLVNISWVVWSICGRESFEWGRILGSWFLLHDNAPPHRTVTVHEFLVKKQVCVLQHPPYLPHLSPMWLFPIPKTQISHERNILWQCCAGPRSRDKGH